MTEQNIYDNQVFFDGYKKLRENPSAANIIVEKPTLFSLCPDLTEKSVLDLGCGYGENCTEFSKMGAKKVVGIDISKKMLDIAKQESTTANVSFFNISMMDLLSLNERFDVIFSSLAVHYIEDFDKLLHAIYSALNENGILVFSQEHPLTTALKDGNFWSEDDEGNILHYNLANYSELGERKTNWIVNDVIKYHRSFSSIINSIISAGLIIEKVVEPVPNESVMEKYPSYKKYYHKPDFLLIKARKI